MILLAVWVHATIHRFLKLLDPDGELLFFIFTRELLHGEALAVSFFRLSVVVISVIVLKFIAIHGVVQDSSGTSASS